MAKLKLGPLADDKPVRMTIELPAALHRDLVAYAAAHGAETGPLARSVTTATILTAAASPRFASASLRIKRP